MPLDFNRISGVIDVEKTQTLSVAVVGAGGSAELIKNLVRCGVQSFDLIDFDRVDQTNIARQGHDHSSIGMSKVEAAAAMLRSINPDVNVHEYPIDILTVDDDLARDLFSTVDLFIAATDSFAAQAKVNQLTLLLGTPALFIGLYAGGLGGEVVWTHPDLDPCFRCLCSERYAAFERATSERRSIDPTSTGADIFAIQLLDAIAGQVGLGLLTRGSPNRFGKLIDDLGDRQFIQVKISPEFRFGDRDIIREKLGIDHANNAFFSWNAIAIPDPDRGQLPCPDCERYRGAIFTDTNGVWKREGLVAESA